MVLNVVIGVCPSRFLVSVVGEIVEAFWDLGMLDLVAGNCVKVDCCSDITLPFSPAMETFARMPFILLWFREEPAMTTG